MTGALKELLLWILALPLLLYMAASNWWNREEEPSSVAEDLRMRIEND